MHTLKDPTANKPNIDRIQKLRHQITTHKRNLT